MKRVRCCEPLGKLVTIRFDADRFKELARIAHGEGFPVSVIVRHLVYRFIEEQRKLAARGHLS